MAARVLSRIASICSREKALPVFSRSDCSMTAFMVDLLLLRERKWMSISPQADSSGLTDFEPIELGGEGDLAGEAVASLAVGEASQEIALDLADGSEARLPGRRNLDLAGATRGLPAADGEQRKARA